MEGLTYFANVDSGQFSLNIVRCYNTSEQMQLTAGDSSNSEQGTMTSATAPAGGGTFNVGQLSACGNNLTQYISMTFNNNTYSVTDPSDNVGYNSGYFTASNSTETTFFYLNGLTAAGTYSPSYFSMYTGAMRIGLASNNSVQMNVTTFGAVNGFIIGTISGNVMDSTTSNVYPMTGSFKVIRTN
jgi:hypothetical protein